jgi:hypothetical protein
MRPIAEDDWEHTFVPSEAAIGALPAPTLAVTQVRFGRDGSRLWLLTKDGGCTEVRMTASCGRRSGH